MDLYLQQAHISSITYNSLKLLKFSNVQKVPGHPATTSTTLEVTGMSRMYLCKQCTYIKKKSCIHLAATGLMNSSAQQFCAFSQYQMSLVIQKYVPL